MILTSQKSNYIKHKHLIYLAQLKIKVVRRLEVYPQEVQEKLIIFHVKSFD